MEDNAIIGFFIMTVVVAIYLMYFFYTLGYSHGEESMANHIKKVILEGIVKEMKKKEDDKE